MSTGDIIYVKQCAIYNRNKKGNRTARTALEIYHAEYPMERVLKQFTHSESGSVYILVMVDQFTKMGSASNFASSECSFNTPGISEQFYCHFLLST